MNPLRVVNRDKRVRIQHDEIGDLARLDGGEVFGQPKELGRVPGCRAERLGGRQSRAGEQCQFVVQSKPGNAVGVWCVGACQYPDSALLHALQKAR